MIVRCTSCSTRFLINPEELGEKGRQVHCGKCGHVWFQNPPQAAPAEIPDSSMQMVSHQLPSLLQKPVPKTLWYVAATAWLVVIVCLAFFFGFRQQIVSVWEPASRLYELVGYEVPVTGEGLKLSNVVSKTYAAEGNKPMVMVTGQVVNTTGEKQKLPVLHLELRDDAQRALMTWELTLPARQIDPGQSIGFLTQQPLENALANNVLVQFAAK